LPGPNRIKLDFAKVKPRLGRSAARTAKGLVEAIGEAIGGVTPTDAPGFYAQ
jgi:hypothetical protein